MSQKHEETKTKNSDKEDVGIILSIIGIFVQLILLFSDAVFCMFILIHFFFTSYFTEDTSRNKILDKHLENLRLQRRMDKLDKESADIANTL